MLEAESLADIALGLCLLVDTVDRRGRACDDCLVWAIVHRDKELVVMVAKPTGLFAEELLSPAARMSLLAGRPADARADIGPIVCSCLGVGRNQIAAEALKGARDVETIGKRLKAGTNCGACRPEIAKLLQVNARDVQPA